MKIILLSGGSGKRLWPISSEECSKQFLKLLSSPSGEMESMVQRIVRQIGEWGGAQDIVVATCASQSVLISSQLGESAKVVLEPERRDTFPAIALSVSYLLEVEGCSLDEVVVVVPSDSYVEDRYFDSISHMVDIVEVGEADIALMGIRPTSPSPKFGYVVPCSGDGVSVERFVEKPDEAAAQELIESGAYWNGGVFAFRLGYIDAWARRYLAVDSFEEFRLGYGSLPKRSFDYEVVENSDSIALVPYDGLWSDLGTWDSLLQHVEDRPIGQVKIANECQSVSVVNYSDLPIICLGVENIIVAVSPDGVLVTTREASAQLKNYLE